MEKEPLEPLMMMQLWDADGGSQRRDAIRERKVGLTNYSGGADVSNTLLHFAQKGNVSSS